MRVWIEPSLSHGCSRELRRSARWPLRTSDEGCRSLVVQCACGSSRVDDHESHRAEERAPEYREAGHALVEALEPSKIIRAIAQRSTRRSTEAGHALEIEHERGGRWHSPRRSARAVDDHESHRAEEHAPEYREAGHALVEALELSMITRKLSREESCGSCSRKLRGGARAGP